MLKSRRPTQTPHAFITQGDTGAVATFALTRADGTAVLLTGASSITAQVKHEGSKLFEKSLVVTDPAKGLVTFSLADGEVLPSGPIYIQAVVKWANNAVDTFPKGEADNFYLQSKPSLGILEATLPVQDSVTCPPSSTRDLQLF